MGRIRMKSKLPDDQRRFAVYCEDGGVPTVLHGSFKAADSQAWKLAKANPDKRFHVLRTALIRVVPATPAAADAQTTGDEA